MAVGRTTDGTPAKIGVSGGDVTEGGTGAQAVEVGREVSCAVPRLSDEDSPACRGSLPPSCGVFAWGNVTGFAGPGLCRMSLGTLA